MYVGVPGRLLESMLKSVSGRRRKIRCTFNPNLPETCNECRLRGSACIDQERSSENPDASYVAVQGEQRYSLRERVAHLENIVQGLVRRLDERPINNLPGKWKRRRLHIASHCHSWSVLIADSSSQANRPQRI